MTNTQLVCSTMIVTSVIAGEHTPPPAQGSTISETLGDDAGGERVAQADVCGADE
ncbi:MAG: hypothetical protein ACLQBX_04575 [Candidatus Limnocylindrales bacterium]